MVTKIVINFCKIAIIYIQRYLLVPVLAEILFNFCKIAIIEHAVDCAHGHALLVPVLAEISVNFCKTAIFPQVV